MAQILKLYKDNTIDFKKTNYSNKISFSETIKFLDDNKIEHKVCSKNHIKVGRINFYLSTGTCYIDGDPSSCKEKGLKVFKKLISREILV